VHGWRMVHRVTEGVYGAAYYLCCSTVTDPRLDDGGELSLLACTAELLALFQHYFSIILAAQAAY
jgi:hypothetical protein